MIRISNTILGIALFALAAAPVVAQTSEPESMPGFGEIVDVRVVNLELVVTDGKERVEGLGADDFRLLVDGKTVPIEFFTEVRDGQALSAAAASTPVVPALAPGESVGNRILVFIDDYFSTPSQRNRVLRRLEEQLPLLGPDDRMAVVAFDGHQVDLLSSWTRSIGELEAALEAAQERRAYGLQRFLDRRGVLRENRFADFDDGVYRRFQNQALYRGGAIYEDTSKVIDAASSALRAFARPSGRKVLLLLSGGWPVAEWIDASFTDPMVADRSAFRPLVDTANRLGYTIYPVDLPGVRQLAAGSAEFATVEESERASYFDRNSERIEEDALYHVADATGGRALIDGAGSVALERTLEDIQSYYWLGFSPVWRENDQRHEVKVEVLRKGLKVRARGSFSDLSRESERTMMVESAQLFDLPLPGSGGLGISFGEATADGFQKSVVPVHLEFPLDQLTVLPDRDQYVIQLELRVAATDDRGHRADIPVIPIELRSDAAPESGEVATYDTSLRLRRRPHRLLFTIHDPVSGDVLSQRTELDL